MSYEVSSSFTASFFSKCTILYFIIIFLSLHHCLPLLFLYFVLLSFFSSSSFLLNLPSFSFLWDPLFGILLRKRSPGVVKEGGDLTSVRFPRPVSWTYRFPRLSADRKGITEVLCRLAPIDTPADVYRTCSFRTKLLQKIMLLPMLQYVLVTTVGWVVSMTRMVPPYWGVISGIWN